jgi:hypothetical protein
MVFVNLGEDGLPAPHGRTEIKYVKDQFKEGKAPEVTPQRCDLLYQIIPQGSFRGSLITQAYNLRAPRV